MFNKWDSPLTKFFKVLILVLCLSLFVYGCVSVANLFKPHDAYKKVDLSYSVGEIVSDSTGKGVASLECKTALFTNEAVKCTGFYVTANFKTRCDYEIHYYTADNVYIGYVSTSDIQYIVDVGDMPVLKDYVGRMNTPTNDISDNYKNATAVLDDKGNEQVAAYIRIVIRAIDGDDQIFSGLSGAFTKLNFANSLELCVTTKAAIN